jgi:hypothetical protein
MVDASSDYVGAVLQQRSSSSSPWQPLALFSMKLGPAQVRYSACDRELLVFCAGIRNFQNMLEGQPFTIYTTQTISHSPMHWARWLMDGQPRSVGNCPMWQNLQLISATCLGWTLWWQTHCPGLPLWPSLDQIAASLHSMSSLYFMTSLHSTSSLHSTTSLHSTLLLLLQAWSSWTTSALPNPADVSIY